MDNEPGINDGGMTLIIDREGRRIRSNRRKKASQPGTQLRRQMFLQGVKWCRVCNNWCSLDKMTTKGLCKSHANEQYRLHYANGGKVAIAQRAHARKRGVAPLPKIAQEILMEQFEGKCAYCEKEIATTWEHIIPISKGGQTEPGNIVPACVHCNSSKKNFELAEWLRKKQMSLHLNLFDVLALAEMG